MSLDELASLMREALSSTSSSTSRRRVVKKPGEKPVKPRGLRREELTKIIQEELRKNIMQYIDIEQIAELVLLKLEEKKRELQRDRRKRIDLSIITQEDINNMLPLVKEFSYNKQRKRHWGPRKFTPSEFRAFLEQKGIHRSLDWVRALLRKMHMQGILEKNIARYSLKEV